MTATADVTDVDVAIAVAQEGAAIVRRRFGTSLRRVAKAADDFATSADLESEAAMMAVLRRQRPGDSIRAEESGASGPATARRTWLIDPLCGTLNYAAGMRIVAVNVAGRDDVGCFAAAVADPFNDELFWTDGVAAFRRTAGEDRALVKDGRSRLVDLNLDPPFPNAPAFRAVTLAADAEFSARFRPRVLSTSLALTWSRAGSGRPTSATATCGTASTSPPGWRSAKPPAVP